LEESGVMKALDFALSKLLLDFQKHEEEKRLKDMEVEEEEVDSDTSSVYSDEEGPEQETKQNIHEETESELLTFEKHSIFLLGKLLQEYQRTVCI